MSREVWRDFICAPDRAGRHLSAIGRGVAGATSNAIDLAVLQAFLERLHDTADDVRLLGSVVDLIGGGYCAFASGPLHRILDALSNEMLAQEQIVGPGLRGNPRWDRTLLQRLAGTLSPVHYVSRTSHRSFELPENQLLSWLVDDLRRTVAIIEQRVGTAGLHADLQALRDDCEQARQHHWFGDISVPLRLTPEMIAAARRHRRPEYRRAAALARRRLEMETNDHHARWYTVLSLLAVNWLEPVNDDDLFELYVLVLVLDLLSDELGFGEPVEYGLVTSRRGAVALFQNDHEKVRVFFDQTPAAVLGIPTEYGKVLAQHRGLSGGERRPDILVVADRDDETRLILIEMKKTVDGRYISDSVYKVFAYLYDFKDGAGAGRTVKALLVVPGGVSAAPGASAARTVFVVSGDDRMGMSKALKDAMAA
ncbi:hypothetical protein [Methylocystis bryophila]|uniref:Uncharacterized protein n=1 Tax=Methylocystis bryophila TaxID=655015 RepID=A0A1W6MY10_9HYPH|nr:hypothetical protein [Methylocystis bryophila]ARN82464.1 hypothetical protein B1812_16780 [Methylocystis bryophila]BDV38652.1 hypothetical protein DSM21852_19050 [Methylocystis bryophila]